MCRKNKSNSLEHLSFKIVDVQDPKRNQIFSTILTEYIFIYECNALRRKAFRRKTRRAL
jgi:hypothetical protein